VSELAKGDCLSKQVVLLGVVLLPDLPLFWQHGNTGKLANKTEKKSVYSLAYAA